MFAQCIQHLPVAPASPAGGRRGSTQPRAIQYVAFFDQVGNRTCDVTILLYKSIHSAKRGLLEISIHLSYYIYYIFLHSTRRHVSLYADFTPHIGLTVSHDLTAPDTPLRVPVYHTMHSIQYAALMTGRGESNLRRHTTLIQEYPTEPNAGHGEFRSEII